MEKNEHDTSLYCISPKGREFISSIILRPRLREGSIEPLTISDYTKDSSILKRPTDVTIVPKSGKDVDSLNKFSNYLLERKKCGVILLDLSSSKLYVHPPRKRDPGVLYCCLDISSSPSKSASQSSSEGPAQTPVTVSDTNEEKELPDNDRAMLVDKIRVRQTIDFIFPS
jgi:hypothetical protein